MEYAKDPKYISGIYNYCDRWCERCQFTSRCLNCALVGEQFGDLQKIDAFNEEFWEKFSEMLQNVFVMVKEMAKEEGIDVDSMDTENCFDNGEIREENALTEIISHLSKKYAKSVDDWFDSKEYLFFQKEDEMKKIRLMSSRKNPAQEAADINDAIEIIRWYQYQIHVKLVRACESALEELTDCDDFPKDSDGSAKVASNWNGSFDYGMEDFIGLFSRARKRNGLFYRNPSEFGKPDGKPVPLCKRFCETGL